MQSTMTFYQYIVKILTAIDFKYTWKHFQNIIRRLTLFTIAEVLRILKSEATSWNSSSKQK